MGVCVHERFFLVQFFKKVFFSCFCYNFFKPNLFFYYCVTSCFFSSSKFDWFEVQSKTFDVFFSEGGRVDFLRVLFICMKKITLFWGVFLGCV